MVAHEFACWECGKEVRGGVCMGPHPGFSLLRAVLDANVELDAENRLKLVHEVWPGRDSTPSNTPEYQRAKAAAWRARERQRLLARRIA